MPDVWRLPPRCRSAASSTGTTRRCRCTPKAFAAAAVPGRRSRAGWLPSRSCSTPVWPGVFVGDAVLKITIRDMRKALGDDSQRAALHRDGAPPRLPLRRAGNATVEPSPAARPPTVAVRTASARPATRAAATSTSPTRWSAPARSISSSSWAGCRTSNTSGTSRRSPGFSTGLASMARLILFDKRGTGLSDPVPVSQLPTLEQRLDDVRAVMEAAGSERAVLLGVSEGGPLCSLFAATYPEKTEALVMIGSYARRLRDADYPWGPTREERDAFCQTIIDEWGGPVGLDERAPSMAADPAFREWWASYLRMGASPGAAVALTRMNAEIDIRDVLPSIRVPTLVLHRTRRSLPARSRKGATSRRGFPAPTFVELPGRRSPAVRRRPGRASSTRSSASCARARARPHAERGAGHGADGRVRRRRRPTASTCAACSRARSRGIAGAAARRGRPSRSWRSFDGPGRAVQCGCSVATVAQRLAASPSAPACTSANASRRRRAARSSRSAPDLADAAGARRGARVAHGRRSGARARACSSPTAARSAFPGCRATCRCSPRRAAEGELTEETEIAEF